MDQPSLNWLKLLGTSGIIGALGLAGAFVAFIINLYRTALEEQNRGLDEENKRLKNRLVEIEADRVEAKSEVSKVIKMLVRLREDSSPDDFIQLAEIIAKVERFQLDDVETFEAQRSAAQWLEYRKDDWIKDAVKVSIQKHAKLVLPRVRKQFQKDIAAYLKWVVKSLSTNGHPDESLGEFVGKPTINSAIPYITAVRHVRDNGDREELTAEQSRYLEAMFDELLRKLPAEFSKSH